MKRLTVLAAAIAVGLTSVAANARDFHRLDVKELEAAFAEAAKAKEAKAEEPKAEEPAEVDPMTTASVTAAGGRDFSPQMSKAAFLARPGEGTPTAKDKELLAATRKGAEKKAVALKATGPYREIVARYASAYGVPVPLAQAVVAIESNYRANVTGRAGEIGLMQIKPATARMMGYSGSAKGLYDPETNVKYGMKYLAKAHELGGGTTCGTILRYNAGHGASRMNPVSAAYCSKVKRRMGST